MIYYCNTIYWNEQAYILIIKDAVNLFTVKVLKMLSNQQFDEYIDIAIIYVNSMCNPSAQNFMSCHWK